ncbi:MAG: helix-turn-helix domain-containing protein [Nitrososphaerales archaeon]|nr:helix-turn-helix domain-containing protein [Nitrososphaerales archaeon]
MQLLREKPTAKKIRRYCLEEARNWADAFDAGDSILKIAARERVDPGTVSNWLHKLGVELRQGQHKVAQPPLKYPNELVELASSGPNNVLRLVRERAWGVDPTERGQHQLTKFCKFIRLHQGGIGVEEIARRLEVHRSTVAEWRNGTDTPYLVKVAQQALANPHAATMKIISLRVESGGNLPTEWFLVPAQVRHYEDFADVVRRLVPNEEAYSRAEQLGITRTVLADLRPELAGYSLGMMLGDAGKLGGSQQRFKSMNIDIQFTKGEESNLMLGEFACLCFNLLGLSMHRIKDKLPSGTQLLGEDPTAAFRWSSNRSPIIAWTFRTCIGLDFGQNTSTSQAQMGWLFDAPYNFRKRFLQALGDSDGTVRNHVSEITSVPNAEFVTSVMKSLGMKTAHTRFENQTPIRSIVSNSEASTVPIFNEFASGYRYQKLMRFAGVI